MPSSGRHFLPIARTTPGWGLTAIKNRLWSFEKGRRTTPPFSMRKNGIHSRGFRSRETPKEGRFAASAAPTSPTARLTRFNADIGAA
jgi:hypothetical protein